MNPLTPALDAHLERREDIAPGLAVFHVRLDPPMTSHEGPAFLAGQYVTVGLPAPDGTLVRRPLTLASTPSDPARVQFLVNRVRAPASTAPLSHLMFDLQVGARLWVRRAATGHFTLEETAPDPDRPVVMVASGTGIAPFLSMIRDRVERAISLSNVALIQCVQETAQVIAGAELDAIEGLRHRVLVGDIRAYFNDPTSLEAGLQLPLRPAHTTVLACGLGADLRDLSVGLLARGYLPQHRRLRAALGVAHDHPVELHLEQYDAERLFDTHDVDLVQHMTGRWQASQ